MELTTRTPQLLAVSLGRVVRSGDAPQGVFAHWSVAADPVLCVADGTYVLKAVIGYDGTTTPTSSQGHYYPLVVRPGGEVVRVDEGRATLGLLESVERVSVLALYERQEMSAPDRLAPKHAPGNARRGGPIHLTSESDDGALSSRAPSQNTPETTTVAPDAAPPRKGRPAKPAAKIARKAKRAPASAAPGPVLRTDEAEYQDACPIRQTDLCDNAPSISRAPKLAADTPAQGSGATTPSGPLSGVVGSVPS